MISKYNHKKLTWVDLEAPQESELSHVIDSYSIPDFIKKNIELKALGDLISADDDYIFVSFNLSQYSPSLNTLVDNKIILIVNNDFIITIHDNPIPSLNIFSKEMELDIIQEERINNNQLLFMYLLKSLFVNSEQQIAKQEILIHQLENQIRQKSKKLKALAKLLGSALILIILISLYVIINL